MKPSDIANALTIRIMNNLKRVKLEPVTRTNIEMNVRAVIEGFCEERGGDPFAVKVDAMDLLIKELNNAIENLKTLSSKNGEVTTASRRFSKYKLGHPQKVTVRSQGRITVGWCFNEGNILEATTLWEGQAYKGLVKGLVLMRRRW